MGKAAAAAEKATPYPFYVHLSVEAKENERVKISAGRIKSVFSNGLMPVRARFNYFWGEKFVQKRFAFREYFRRAIWDDFVPPVLRSAALCSGHGGRLILWAAHIKFYVQVCFRIPRALKHDLFLFSIAMTKYTI
jgi:hypothetical protein